MSLLLLDTTFLIDAERGLAELDSAIEDDDDAAIAAVSLAELLVGVKLATGKRRSSRQEFVDSVAESLPIVGYDETVARDHADLLVAIRKAGTPRGAHDLIIAATARATSRTIVTADRAAFEGLPGVVLKQYR